MAPPAAALDPARASTFVISITPFHPDGSFDEPGIRSHLRRLAAAGVGVYLGGGGSGEGYVLSGPEARRLLEIGVEELQGKVPIRSMGTEPRSAVEMVEQVRISAVVGVDAAQIYSLDAGHGHRPTRPEIQAYFDDVLSAVAIPSVISTHQSVGYAVPVDMLAGFVETYDHVIGINVTNQDLGYLADVIDAVGERVDVHVGGPAQALTAWSLGATGFLSSEANLAPELCMAVVAAYQTGDGAALTQNFGKLLRLYRALYAAGGIRATKAVLDRLKLAGGAPRKPQLPIAETKIDELLELTRELGLGLQS